MWNIDEIQNLWQFATEKHNGQKYGGQKQGEQVEYINHIGSVVFEIINIEKVDIDMNMSLAIKCAILHDTLEDTNLTFEEVQEKFGVDVAKGVLALTKDDNIKDKKLKMVDSLKRIKDNPKEIWAVKMADRIANLYAPPYYWTNEKILEYIEESKLILEQLKEGNIFLAERLKQKIKDYNTYLK